MAQDSGTGFSEFELAAMKERAAELRAEKGGKKKADNLASLHEKIEEMPDEEKAIALAVHQIISDVAPGLTPRTWYGMPAYDKDGKVLVFLQGATKFETRYTTLGFNDNAALDDGEMWATSFAIPALTESVRETIADLVTRAVGA